MRPGALRQSKNAVKHLRSVLETSNIQTKYHLAVARLEARHVWFLTATTLYNRTSDLRGSLAILYSGLRRSEVVNDVVTDNADPNP